MSQRYSAYQNTGGSCSWIHDGKVGSTFQFNILQQKKFQQTGTKDFTQ